MDWLPLLLFVAFGALAAIQAWRFLHWTIRPPMENFRELRDSLRRMQLAAAKAVVDARADGEAPVLIPGQTATIGDAVRFVYSISQDDDGYRHALSAQLVDSTQERKRLLWMFDASRLLTDQLAIAGIDEEQAVWSTEDYDPRRSPTDPPENVAPEVREISFRLSPERHSALLETELAVIESSIP